MSTELVKSPGDDGLIEPGNIDLHSRPVVKNPDGSVSTVLSVSFGTDQGEVLVPKVSPDGRVMSDSEAFALYRKTGQHLGIFRTPEQATSYAQFLHQEQAAEYATPASTTESPYRTDSLPKVKVPEYIYDPAKPYKSDF